MLLTCCCRLRKSKKMTSKTWFGFRAWQTIRGRCIAWRFFHEVTTWAGNYFAIHLDSKKSLRSSTSTIETTQFSSKSADAHILASLNGYRLHKRTPQPHSLTPRTSTSKKSTMPFHANKVSQQEANSLAVSKSSYLQCLHFDVGFQLFDVQGLVIGKEDSVSILPYFRSKLQCLSHRSLATC